MIVGPSVAAGALSAAAGMTGVEVPESSACCRLQEIR